MNRENYRMNATEILNILADWNYWGSFRTQLLQRTPYLRKMRTLFSDKEALALVGIRRAGKSSLVHLYLQEMFAKKALAAKQSLIINFEDPRFSGRLDGADLHQIYEVYLRQLKPEKPLVVLDEVQNVEGWERFVRYLLEAQNAQVIVTGSSSKLLSSELATVLTGRHIDIEVFPLSFKELLDFKGIAHCSDVDAAKNRIAIQSEMDAYLRWGGFPEVVLSNAGERKRELLAHYFDDILSKDLVKRFNIKEVQKMEQLAHLFVTNTAALQSFNRLKDLLQLSLDTVQRFARYFEMVRLFYFIKKYEYSLGKQMRSTHKVYLADNGFYEARGFRFSDNIGRLAENCVAVELFKRRTFSPLEIYYWKDYQQREVDFVVKEQRYVRQLIQVCWDISNEGTLKREVTSLLRASRELNCDDLLVVTENADFEREYQNNGVSRKIRFVPLWRWMLS